MLSAFVWLAINGGYIFGYLFLAVDELL